MTIHHSLPVPMRSSFPAQPLAFLPIHILGSNPNGMKVNWFCFIDSAPSQRSTWIVLSCVLRVIR